AQAGGMVGAFAALQSATAAAVNDPGQAQTMVRTPWGTMPFEAVVANLATVDLLVHTWDLSRAAGLDEQLDEAVVADAYQRLEPVLAGPCRPAWPGAWPSAGRGAGGPGAGRCRTLWPVAEGRRPDRPPWS